MHIFDRSSRAGVTQYFGRSTAAPHLILSWLTKGAPVLNDCRSLILEFGKVVIEHCNRDSNKVAHVLAQQGRVDPPAMWLDSPPDFIRGLLADDVSVI